MIENWIDTLTQVFAFTDPLNRTVRSFKLFESEEFPEAIPIADGPVALSIPGSVSQGVISTGNAVILYWKGVTEIHVTKDLAKANLPLLVQYYGRIVKACAANLTLGGLVAHFEIDFNGGGIEGPVELKYGQEDAHYGFLVYWEVKEMLGSSEVTVSA